MTLVSGFEKIVRHDEPLAACTWLKLGGPAEFFAQPNSVDELAALVWRCREEDVSIHILGGGSNLLVRDSGVSGMVVALASPSFSQIHINQQTVSAGGGAKLGHVISAAVAAGLAGLEPLVGVPGTVGGALHANAGTRGGDVGQWASQATVMTHNGEILVRERSDLVFAYRQSSLGELVILTAEFRLEQDDPDRLTKHMQKQWIVKKASQPMAHENPGRIFKNPRGMSAAMLIDQAGLRDAQVGEVRVSPHHANYIVARQGATATDVLKLIDQIRSTVADRLGVELETEIEIW